MKSLGEQLASDILAAEVGIKAKLDELKKTHEILKNAAEKIAKKPWPFSDTRKLLDELAARSNGLERVEVQQLHERLKKQLDDAAKTYERAFVDGLISEARKTHIPAGSASDAYFLGPFQLTLDFVKETGLLRYADQPIAAPMALDATKLVAAASEHAGALLVAPTDLAKLANDFEEAMRVALTRSRKPIEGRELRCALPDLHREMTAIRQDRGRTITSNSFRDYPLARFVVELKTLVQSEQNMTASKRFRLETAVLENTRNSKKSVLIPTDLQRGYAGGTYFQALVLVNEA
ncbi:hypothetical protein LBMAG52_05020 [Planctomycetia bacterium]|nr:hypothetical protein LBMAG52_05020 [Planctomycetia bacterium]